MNYAVKKGASLKCYSKDQALTNYLTRLNDVSSIRGYLGVGIQIHKMYFL